MRIPRTAAPALAALALLGASLAVAAAPARADAAPAACDGTTTLAVTLGFDKPAYTTNDPGVTVVETAVNCTGQTLAVHHMPYGTWSDAAGQHGSGCPMIDPVWTPVTIAPNAAYTTSVSFPKFSGCVAASFTAYDSFSDDATGANLASPSATVQIVQAPPLVGCHVAYTNQGEWPGGFTSAIAITNTGLTAFDGWTLSYLFGGDQQVASVWGAGLYENGNYVSLDSLPWDASIPVGATINYVGMTGTFAASDAAPHGFVLNGVACT